MRLKKNIYSIIVSTRSILIDFTNFLIVLVFVLSELFWRYNIYYYVLVPVIQYLYHNMYFYIYIVCVGTYLVSTVEVKYDE